ncbi:hypothetical protein N9Y42_06760 [Mariniblastus sp.]|nr:hypothetical protein [Mariniblastus sp.]
MLEPFQELIIYLRIAQAYKNRLQMSDRDRALVMAGTCATVLQMHSIANFCRRLILQNNQGHMLRKYDTFAEALGDSDFGVFVKQVRKKLAPETAETNLQTMGYRCEVLPSDYETKIEFAAAVMGIDADWLMANFGE